MSLHSAHLNFTNTLMENRQWQQAWRGSHPNPSYDTITKTAAKDVLARSTAISFQATVKPIGSFMQTGIHRQSALIHRTSEIQFKILTPAAWARNVVKKTCFNATPVGFKGKKTN